MSTLSRFSLLCFRSARPVVMAGALLISQGAWTHLVLAQTTVFAPPPASARTPGAFSAGSAPAPFALTTQPVRLPGVNVLIIALDDPMSAGAPDAVPLTGAPLTGAPPAVTPYPDVPLTALPPAPASWNGALRPNWSVLAKKKPSAPDPRFLPIPDPPTNTNPNAYGNGNGVGTGARPDAGGAASPLPAAPAPPVMMPPRAVALAGRSTLAAVSLRRALMGLGYANVEAASPDSNIIARALGDKRLSPSTFATLRGAMQRLAFASALPETIRAGAIAGATKTANDAAAALGQATGYRAVIALYVAPLAEGKTPFALVLDDSASENGEPILWSESAKDDASARETGASTGAALVDKSLRLWPTNSPVSVRTLADAHLARARAAGTAGDTALAQDEVLRVSVLDPSRTEAFTFLGDLLSPVDPAGATAAYGRATQINKKDGESFAKMAMAYINSPKPDFPRVLDAGKQAILNGADSADLRIAMARAQFGRAGLFRRADQMNNNSGSINNNASYINNAEDAEASAQLNLDRALELSPNNPEALKLMARALITSGRTIEGVQTLDRIAPLFPQDVELQFQYASALLSMPTRKEDAFVAFSRVWKARGQSAANVDDTSAQFLLQGFDQHVFALGKAGRQLSDGVAGGSIGREGAFLQLKRLKADMSDASDAIALLRPPSGSSGAAAIARTFAASLMSQSLEAQQTFLDTGQDVYRTRANEFFRGAVAQLNSARTSR